MSDDERRLSQEDPAREAAASEAPPPENEAVAPAPPAPPSDPLRDALSCVVLDEPATWRKALREAGFSDAESGRLIFERLRPRDEGRTRHE